MAGSILELQQFTDILYNCQRHTVWIPYYGSESGKSMIMVNELLNIHSNVITMNGETLEKIDKFKYMGAILTKDGKSDKEIQIRLATAN